MALTRTRTRTQTALTKLATMVAEVHGELEFVEGLLAQVEVGNAVLSEEQAQSLRTKRIALEQKRQALYLTLGQFDSRISPEKIGCEPSWRRRHAVPSARSNHHYLTRLLASNANISEDC